jgi:hypothetical protein
VRRAAGTSVDTEVSKAERRRIAVLTYALWFALATVGGAVFPRDLERAKATLRAELGREPTEDEFTEYWMRTARTGAR